MRHWLRRNLDIWDILTVVALGLIGWGLWGYDPRLALVAVGVVVLFIAFLGALKRGNTESGG